MGKLFILHDGDEEALSLALSIEDSAIVLLQDAVYHCGGKPLMVRPAHGGQVYALGVDVTRRGLDPGRLRGLACIGYGELVDLLLSGVEVINL